MNERYALVTGGTSGIGFHIAKKLAEKNVHLALVYLSDDLKAGEAKEKLQQINNKIRIELIKWDLSDIENLILFPKKLKELFPDSKLGYLVSCHGQIKSNLFILKKRSDVLNVINEHLISNVVLTHELLKEMCQNRFGRVLFLTSLASKKINRGQADYALAKAGLEIFVKSLTAEYFHRNVTFNCISAGLTNTRLSAGIAESYEEKNISGAKVVDVKNIAKLANLLLDEASNDISGSTFSIDGGQACLGNNMDYHRLGFNVKD